MNNELDIETLSALGVIPDGIESSSRDLICAALEHEAGLSPSDYLTMRDLLRLSGYDDTEVRAVLLSMFISLNEGSICLKFDKASVLKKLGVFLKNKDAIVLAARITRLNLLKKYPELISSREQDYKPLILKSIGKESFLYFHKFPRYEAELKAALYSHINHDASCLPVARIKEVVNEVLEKHPIMSGKIRFELNDEQRLAVCIALLKDFIIVSGGPGTGKTSIVLAMLRCLVRCGIAADEIFMTAPTGRAAQRLADSLQKNLSSIKGGGTASDAGLSMVRQSTIHALLGYNPSNGNFTYNAQNKLPLKAVIIDEVSMIDIVLMARLFEALGPGTKTILLGDKDQLPSVEAGAVLAELIPKETHAIYSEGVIKELGKIYAPFKKLLASGSGHGKNADTVSSLTDRIVILKRSYRSSESILKMAASVNKQESSVADIILPLPQKLEERISPPGVFFLDYSGEDIGNLHKTLDSWISIRYFARMPSRKGAGLSYRELLDESAKLKLTDSNVADRDSILERLFSYLEEGKILSMIKRGPFGTYAINRYIARRLQPEFDKGNRYGYFSGAPIMIIENDPIHGLYNGDVGVVLKTKEGSYRAVFKRPGAFSAIPIPELPLSDSAFAITVHKSQGSEYDNILFVLPPDADNRLMSKEIVYTGLTRARRSVLIYGSREVLRSAIGRKIERQSGLKLWE